MKLRRVLILYAIVGLIFSLSCHDPNVVTGVDNITNNVENTPAIANIQNSFSISVAAKSFNSALEYPITFNNSSLNMALAILDLSSGEVSIQVFNNEQKILYKADFLQKISLAQTIFLDEKPTKIKFIFNTLTANFNCSLSTK